MKNMTSSGDFKDLSANNPEMQREEILNYCSKHGLQTLSTVTRKSNHSIVASAREDVPILVGCRQIGKKKFKIYVRENLSEKEMREWLLLTYKKR